MPNQQNDKKGTNVGAIIAVVFIIIAVIVIVSSCSGGSSKKSGKSWGDLNEQEKDNARWAYSVYNDIH